MIYRKRIGSLGRPDIDLIARIRGVLETYIEINCKVSTKEPLYNG
jgi:hypothetical protein